MTASDPKAILRNAKLRVTSTRLDVLRVLGSASGAIDAQSLFDRLAAEASGASATDRVTVYRTLNALVDAGLAHRVDPGDRVFRFSLTDHSRCEGDHHHDHEHPHLVCDSCGVVECMDDAEVIIRRRESAAPTTPLTWRVKQQSVTVRGTCGRCQQPTKPERKRQASR